MNPSDAWEMVKRTISTSPSVINALAMVKLEGVENNFLILSGLSSSKSTVDQFQRPILEMMGKKGVEATDIDYIAPTPKFQIVQADTPMPSQESELDRLRRENAELRGQVSDLRSRLEYQKALHSDKQPNPIVGGCNWGFLLPLIPTIPTGQTKALLTLLVLGGAVNMTAVEFARVMGIKTKAVSYKRLFAGLENMVQIDGKNLALQASFQKNLAPQARNESALENENLLNEQETENQNLLVKQESNSELAPQARNSPPHNDYDDDINKKSSSGVESSIMELPILHEVLRFARDRINFNPKAPPKQLAQHDPLNAIALVLQAQHNAKVQSKAGLWKTMINQFQKAEQHWLDVASEAAMGYAILGTFSELQEAS